MPTLPKRLTGFQNRSGFFEEITTGLALPKFEQIIIKIVL
jgi:hypothetical protein